MIAANHQRRQIRAQHLAIVGGQSNRFFLKKVRQRYPLLHLHALMRTSVSNQPALNVL